MLQTTAAYINEINDDAEADLNLNTQLQPKENTTHLRCKDPPTIAVYSENHNKQTNTLCGQNEPGC